MKQLNLTEILKNDKNNLNMEYHKRRLIVLAVVKPNYRLEVAYDLNAPYDMNYDSYVNRFYREGFTLETLKIAVEKIKKEERKLKKKRNGK